MPAQKLTTHLELLGEVESNGVILFSRLEVIAWLHKGGSWCGHADLGIVSIVARDIPVQFLQVHSILRSTVEKPPMSALHSVSESKTTISLNQTYSESLGDCCL